MFEFAIGIAVGAAFSPFWTWAWKSAWNYALTFDSIRNIFKTTPVDGGDTK